MSIALKTPYGRVYNFSAGPCTLPVEVLEEARDSIMNYNGSGASVMELSHRGKDFEAIHAETQASLRQLMGIPENYKIMFLQGGASMQFSMIPMNLRASGSADYVLTGAWGKRAIESAKLLPGETNVIYDGKENNFSDVPSLGSLNLTPGANFVHYTTNETIGGVEFPSDPSDGSVTWIADMSSDILSRPVDVSKYSMIYAGAQKNMGPAGTTLVIMRDDLLEQCASGLTPMLDYKIQAENDSMYNTPPCWGIYMCGLVYKWLLKNGGLSAMQATNAAKAAIIYDAIDGTDFYKGHAQSGARSKMNITFTLPSDELTSAFVKASASEGMIELKGHRSVGGCRASIYNAFPIEGCQALADFMKEFAKSNS